MKIIKKILINILLISISVLFSLLIGEGIIRIFCDPVDYLEPEMISDDILRFKIKPNSAGHDAWGYRNKSIPKKADIVTIGDSQTYGISATASNSWPSYLQKVSQKKVYNLSLGGYGPMEYFYLLQTKALLLNPSAVIVGFYYGNDLSDAYSSVYGVDHWKELRKIKSETEKQQEQNQIKEVGIVKDMAIGDRQIGGHVREWLVQHSVLYRMAAFSIGDIFRFMEMKYFYPDKDITIYEDKKNNIHTGFNPSRRLNGLNLQNPNVKEGLSISLDIFDKMKQLCLSKNIKFSVVLIPTKETVYGNYVENNTVLKNADAINSLISNERAINTAVKTYFAEHDIKYIDPLDSMKIILNKTPLYPNNIGDHPVKEGYQVIANVVKQTLKNN